MVILLAVGGEQVTAVVNTSSQETRVGKEIYYRYNSELNPMLRKKVIRASRNLVLAEVITLYMGVTEHRQLPIECMLDSTMQPFGINIGLRALDRLGFAIRVGNREATMRSISSDSRRRRRQ